MATNPHQFHASRAFAEVMGPSTRRSKRASAQKPRSAQWERRIEADWQGHLDTLRECISELLIHDQQPRMAMSEAGKRGRD
jgi:hypothetical protein